VNKVKTSLIKVRRIVFTPAVELKEELRNTAVIISCYDRDGKEVKRVTSTDDAEIDDGTGTNTGTNTGSNTGGGNTGGNSGGGGNGGEDGDAI
jgi:uncharacterized membrane protein YgcG